MSKLSLEEKIGQRFIVGINSDNTDLIIKLVKEGHVGGVVLYKRNYKTYEEMIEFINRCKEANKDNKLPLFIAIDQEGGVVNRLPKEIHKLEEIYLYSKKNPDKIDLYAGIISDILRDTGINMDFAPVVDIYNNSKSQALESRCFYGDKDNVTKLAKVYVNEFSKRGVIPVIKHYPGHGATRLDSHFFVPYVFNYKMMLEKHMVPFDALIEDNIDAIMVGHMLIRKMCGCIPTSINRSFIMNYLRSRYDNLIISDECTMLKRHFIYRFMYEGKITDSGCDMVLLKLRSEDDFSDIVSKYRKRLDKDDSKVLELDTIIARIEKIKNKYNISDKLVKEGVVIDKINKRIDDINKLMGEEHE